MTAIAPRENAAPANTQKGTGLFGGAVSEEVLESSEHVLHKTQYGGIKGLQQFFTPEPIAQLAAYVVSSGGSKIEMPTFDPTAGNGSLLRFVDPANSFGVEIDPDQIAAAEGSYQAIKGDIQKAMPLIYRVCPSFPAILANPPFGLKDWSDETVRDGMPIGSARLTFIYAMRQLQEDGQLVFICGRDQFDREIAPLPEAKGVYYVVKIDDVVFENSTHPIAIAFAVHPELRAKYDGTVTEGFETKSIPMEMVDLIGPKILEARNVALHNGYNTVSRRSFGLSHLVRDAWEAVGKEYERRRKAAEGEKQKREFDVELVGGKMLHVTPSPYVALALGKKGLLHDLKRLNGKTLDWFASYERDWIVVEEALADNLISVDPRVIEKVEEVLTESRRTVCPLYPVSKTQRLGYLTDLNQIKCVKEDPERGFVAGESYRIEARSTTQVQKTTRIEQVMRGKNAGEYVERNYEQQRKVLKVTLDGRWSFTDSASDQSELAYFLSHFELPDPGDVGSRYPAETEANRAILRRIEANVIAPNSEAYAEKHPDKPAVKLRKFQIEDIARLMVKGSGLLAWEQGLGKTLAAFAYYLACVEKGAQEALLLIVPQDLIPQIQAECERFLGRKMEVVKTHGQAKQIAKKLRMGGTGLYITYYEALATVGTSRSEMLDEIIVEQRTEVVKVKGTGRYGRGKLAVKGELVDGVQEWVGVTMDETGKDEYGRPEHVYRDADGNVVQRPQWVPADWDVRGAAAERNYAFIREMLEERVKAITSKHICPECKADRQNGWNGKFCRAVNAAGETCGYSHYLHRVKPMGSLLSTAFRRGVIVVDEGTMIQGDYSARSQTVRGLRARYKLLMTGTPVKNYIPQAFWLLWWALGNQSKRFPYGYHNKGDFENNHAVIEWFVSGGKKQGRKVLPEVTNLSQLWRLLASSIIRRRKEETGEPLVKRTLYPITVPLGEGQHAQLEAWRKKFPAFFEEKYPDAPVVKAGMHEVMAPMLGLGMKLDYAATIPLGDPDWDWTGVEGVSNFTPANLRTLEIAMTLAKQGRKVLVGSQWIPTAKWLAEQLEAKGVPAAHLLDANGNTAPPAQRAKAVQQFQSGKVQVLCVGIQAIRLGHNLDAANAAVINGLPWDFESFDQFIARIHRLTSKKPVDVYVVIPGSQGGDQGTITRRKWDILRQKGDAASLALDGRLIEANEAPVSESEVVKSLAEKGIALAGDEVPESEIQRIWEEVPHLDLYEIDESILHPTLDVVEAFGEGAPTIAAVEQYEEPIGPKHALADDTMQAVFRGLDAFFDSYRSWRAACAVEWMFIRYARCWLPGLRACEGIDSFVDLVRSRLEPVYEPASAVPLPMPPRTDEREYQPAPLTEAKNAEQAQLSLLSAPEPEPVPALSTITPTEAVEAIKGFKELLDLGAMSEDEFAAAKASTLARMEKAA